MRIFEHYLTAYWFCVSNNIDTTKITKKAFKEWQVETDIVE
jgi:hypothetical protein